MRCWNMATVMALKPGTGALTLVADADHDHRAGLADGTEGLPDVLVLDDADADDRRVKRDFPRRRSTRNGTATAPRSRPGRASSTWPRSWTWPPGGYSASRSATTTTPL